MMITTSKVYSLAIFFVCLAISKLSFGQVYGYVDPDGKLIVSDKKVDARYKKFDPHFNPLVHRVEKPVARVTKKAVVTFQSGSAQQFNNLITAIAQEVGINQHLLHAVIQVESAYNPKATSPKGAKGLMQLIPATAERFGTNEVYDPESNVRGGARFLKYLLKQFDYNLHLALAAYNAGEGAVRKYNNTIPAYAETQDYVSRVITIFEQRKFREKGRS